MSTWQVAVFGYGAVLATAGLIMVGWWWWERRTMRRAEAMFDRVFAARAGIDLSRTVEPTFLGRRK